HLLNVPCTKMSAFSDRPSHFLDWVLSLPTYRDKDANQIAASFLPRKLYGSYLESIWENALTTAASKHIKVNIINSVVTHLNVSETGAALDLDNGNVSNVHYAIIATGNHTPRHPSIENMAFYESETYDQNPWLPTAISAPHNNNLPILILGNGLTMVDTVLALQERDSKVPIRALSPNGYTLVPHKEASFSYSKLIDELDVHSSLYNVIKLVNKHRKQLQLQGLSAEPVIDSLRPYSQTLWKNFSTNDRQRFVFRCRHLWNKVRHRIPMQSYQALE